MQLRKTSAFALYVGSYLPLGVVLLAQDVDLHAIASGACRPKDWMSARCGLPLSHPSWSLGMVAIGILCLVATLWTLRETPAPHRIRIRESKHVPADLINYAMPYVVSFMGLDFASPLKLAGFGVFFLWMFWITYRSGQIVMNPILIVFGWRLYEIGFSYLGSDDDLIGRCLSKGDVEPGRLYRRGSLQDVMIVREVG